MTGASSCEICEIGTVAPEPGAISCELCPAGTQNTDNGKTATEHDAWSDCRNCPSGMISTELRSTCVACAAGTEEVDHTSCANCTKGRFSAKDGEECEGELVRGWKVSDPDTSVVASLHSHAPHPRTRACSNPTPRTRTRAHRRLRHREVRSICWNGDVRFVHLPEDDGEGALGVVRCV